MLYPNQRKDGYFENNGLIGTSFGKTLNAEQIWQQFEVTGSVADYLSYCDTLRNKSSDNEHPNFQ